MLPNGGHKSARERKVKAMSYAIYKKCHTPAHLSVDGKEHNYKLWYAGTMDILGMEAPVWRNKKERVVFRTKAEAKRALRRPLTEETNIEQVK